MNLRSSHEIESSVAPISSSQGYLLAMFPERGLTVIAGVVVIRRLVSKCLIQFMFLLMPAYLLYLRT